MADKNKEIMGIGRGEMSFLIAIVIGLLIGVFIKRVRIGLMLGLILGVGIVFMKGLRKR
ncbi:hypothetical protein [Niabella soli]|uniref:Uncharacterized protein n=1 Tax=Niabella soli DSM 19437 TaxID=929713 RepID=W0F7A2_9BACT|nr:hypothetical protein [Niabella soli]AHF17226.1 hypothetical protein NIASO_04075 [Niabella soli DSM 19437]